MHNFRHKHILKAAFDRPLSQNKPQDKKIDRKDDQLLGKEKPFTLTSELKQVKEKAMTKCKTHFLGVAHLWLQSPK
jgi:hypothetical protein